MKKAFALILAVVMIMAVVVPASAAETTYTVTINNEVKDHTYEAYQIFAGALYEDAESGKIVLSDISWGTGVDTTKTVDNMTLLQALNAKFTKNFANEEEVVAWLASGEVTSDSVTLDTFAEVVGKYLNVIAGTSKYVEAVGDTAAYYEITGLNAGYYLVKDKDGTLDTKYDAYTKYILRVVKNQEVSPKSDVPKGGKEINDVLDGNYDKFEDFDIADTAYYKLTGTLPNNLFSYDSYYFKFNDTLPVGINFTRIEKIYIEGHDDNIVYTFYDASTDSALPEGINLNVVPGVFVRDEDGKISATTTQESVSIEFEDLLKLYPNLLTTHKIIVKYSAFVNRDALISSYGKYYPMTNSVDIEYSNNPNGDGHGKTVPVEAYAFTFKFNVDKYDADDVNKKLEGAEFVLYYQRVENEQIVKHYAQVVTEEMIYKTDEDGKLVVDAETGEYVIDEDRVSINGKQVEPYNLGNIYAWTTDKSAASILDTDSNGFLTVGGLDSGVYYLEETKAPAGYNLMETPVQVDIKPTYDANGKLTAVNYEVDSISQASDTVGVRNDSGSTLPVTGGMGTTLFYALGGVMVAAAAILLITKKRMAA